MEGYYHGYPRRNYVFSPYSNPNNYLNPYHNSSSQPNQYRNPNPNPNPNPHHSPNPTLKPRVVSIPIQFVNSDSLATPPPPQQPAPATPLRPSPEMAAVKLQKVMRGFLVRKNLRTVRKIEAEAAAIGEEIARDEMILEKEVKARIRVGEMLMRLLFRLDSVRGVRDYRKKVIKKVISLQELVDSIGARGDKVESDTIEDNTVDSIEYSVQNPNSLLIEENKVVESPIDAADSIDSNKCTEKDHSVAHLGENMVVEAVDSMKESPIEPIKSIETPQMKKLGGEPNSDEVCDRSNFVDQAHESSQVMACNNESNDLEMKGVRDIMERVLVESERMKNLMEELCQRSAQQWRLTEGLVDRVQRLEREVGKMEKRDKKKRKGKGRRGESCGKKCSQWN